jgi:hypothetical protein
VSLGFDVRPEPLGQVVLTTSYVDIFICPALDADSNPVKGATVREITVANNDLNGSGLRTGHRVWIDKLPVAGTPLPETAQVSGEVVLDGLDFEGVMTLAPGEKIVGKADAGALVGVSVYGALTVLKP